MLRIFVLLISAVCLRGAPVSIDFSRSHTYEDLKRSGLVMKPLAGFKPGDVYSFGGQEIVVILPGGMKISQHVTLGVVDLSDGSLTRFSMKGEIMPQNQAYQIAKRFCESFDLSHNELDGWYQRNLGQQSSSDALGISPNLNYYPRITIGIQSGHNRLYPWTVGLILSWSWREHRDWDEQRAWQELKRPAIPEISFNPLSGLRYRREDEFAYLFDKGRNGGDKAGSASRAANPVKDTHVPAGPEKQNAAEATNAPWWRWGFAAGLLLLALVWVLNLIRRNR